MPLQRHQAPRIFHRQRAQHRRIHQAEDRRIRPNAQRQCQHSNHGETRRLPQHPQPKPDILHQPLQSQPAAFGFVVFPRALCPAKLQPRSPPRFFRGVSCPHHLFAQQRKMRLHLLMHALSLFPPHQAIAQPCQQPPQTLHARSSARAFKNRPTISAVCCQPSVSSCNRRCPARVSL